MRSRLDESICSRKGWQVGSAVFCQITLDTCIIFGISDIGLLLTWRAVADMLYFKAVVNLERVVVL